MENSFSGEYTNIIIKKKKIFDLIAVPHFCLSSSFYLRKTQREINNAGLNLIIYKKSIEKKTYLINL